MPTKDLAPFSYISPPKNPLFTDKVWPYYRILVSKWVKSQKTEKTATPTNPATAPRRKFLSLLRYQLLIDVNKMRVKNITVTVSVRVSDNSVCGRCSYSSGCRINSQLSIFTVTRSISPAFYFSSSFMMIMIYYEQINNDDDTAWPADFSRA